LQHSTTAPQHHNSSNNTHSQPRVDPFQLFEWSVVMTV
jgi:hypothetical protein